jgi:hypothetical protein
MEMSRNVLILLISITTNFSQGQYVPVRGLCPLPA